MGTRETLTTIQMRSKLNIWPSRQISPTRARSIMRVVRDGVEVEEDSVAL